MTPPGRQVRLCIVLNYPFREIREYTINPKPMHVSYVLWMIDSIDINHQASCMSVIDKPLIDKFQRWMHRKSA